jgi:hypothetical protein
VAVAAGPFTTTDDLSYEPLSALLAALGSCPPDVLLLLGPFVDAEHPEVRAWPLALLPPPCACRCRPRCAELMHASQAAACRACQSPRAAAC